MAPKKLLLTAALLSSTLFTFFPSLSYAIVDLDAAANNQDTSNAAYPPGTGYNFIAPNVTFSLLDNDFPGTDGTVSFANNLNVPGSPFANTIINFVANNDVGGDVGSLTNPLSKININTGFTNGAEVAFQGSILVADSVHLFDDGLGNHAQITFANANPGTLEVRAPLTTQVDGTNIILVSEEASFFEQIGQPNKIFFRIDIQNDSTFNANVYANEVLFNGNNELVISNATVFAPINTAVDGEGMISFFGVSRIVEPIETAPTQINTIDIAGPETNVSVENNINSELIEVRLGATARFFGVTNNSADIFNVNDAGSTLALAHGAQAFFADVTADDLNFGAGTFLEVDMAGDLTPVGFFNFAGTITPNAATTVRVRNPSFSPGQTQSFIILQDNAGAGFPLTLPVIENSLLSNITVTSNGNTMLLNISSAFSADFAPYSNTNPIAHALDQIAVQILSQPGSGALRDVLAQMGQFYDAQALNQALASLAPIVDGAYLTEAFMNQQNVFGDISERMDTVRFWQSHLGQGISNGDDCIDCNSQDSAWIKIIGHHAEQDERDNIAGYHNNMQGVIAGWDLTWHNALTIGSSLSWTYSRIDHKVWEGSKSDIHSIQVNAYFGYNCTTPLFFDTIIGLAYNNYNQYREVQFGTLHLRPHAEFDGWQLGIKSEIGYVMDSQFYNSHVVPNVALYYSHLIISAYDESGAGTASQSMERSNYDALILSAGVKFLQDWVDKAVLIQPDLHFNVYYDFVGDRQETDSQFFAGVGPEIRTLGFEASRLGANVGAAASLYTHHGVTWTAEYDFNVKADYFSHTGFLRARYVWG